MKPPVKIIDPTVRTAAKFSLDSIIVQNRKRNFLLCERYMKWQHVCNCNDEEVGSMTSHHRECNRSGKFAIEQFHAHLRFKEVVVVRDALLQKLECIPVCEKCEIFEKHLKCSDKQNSREKFKLEGIEVKHI